MGQGPGISKRPFSKVLSDRSATSANASPRQSGLKKPHVVSSGATTALPTSW